MSVAYVPCSIYPSIEQNLIPMINPFSVVFFFNLVICISFPQSHPLCKGCEPILFSLRSIGATLDLSYGREQWLPQNCRRLQKFNVGVVEVFYLDEI